jgi:hypothetical protein
MPRQDLTEGPERPDSSSLMTIILQRELLGGATTSFHFSKSFLNIHLGTLSGRMEFEFCFHGFPSRILGWDHPVSRVQSIDP